MTISTTFILLAYPVCGWIDVKKPKVVYNVKNRVFTSGSGFALGRMHDGGAMRVVARLWTRLLSSTSARGSNFVGQDELFYHPHIQDSEPIVVAIYS